MYTYLNICIYQYIYIVKTCIFHIYILQPKKRCNETCYLLPFCPTFCRTKTRSLGLGLDCLRNTRDVPPFRRHPKSPRIRRAWCPRPNCTWPGCFLEKTTAASNQVYKCIKPWEINYQPQLVKSTGFLVAINSIISLPCDVFMKHSHGIWTFWGEQTAGNRSL